MTSEKERGPVAVTTGAPCNAMGAIAGSAYAKAEAAGNEAVGACKRMRRPKPGPVAFRAQTGRIWLYGGKRGRVLAMLATTPVGVTQWDTLPWHTRLGSTIHALRRDGLAIDTERVGEFRHARYRLATPGCLIEQAGKNRGRA